jgi:hypothetical protein
VHFSNYTLNKCSSNFIVNDECHEINNGSKRTFTSYFKQLEQDHGIERDSIWKKMKLMCSSILKAYKPYIQYHCKCHFPFRPGKLFHIIGIDIMFDQNMKPYLLEINSNPSLNVDFTPTDARPTTSMAPGAPTKGSGEKTHRPKKSIDATAYQNTNQKKESLVDIFVKKRALCDIVFMLKNVKFEEICSAEFTEYRSYEKIFDSTMDKALFKNVNEMDRLFEIFCELGGGVRFTKDLSKAKFVRCVRWFNRLGTETLQLMDGDNAYNNVVRDRGEMDFQGFISAFYELVNKAYGSADPSVIKSRIHDVFNRYDWHLNRVQKKSQS